MPLRVRVRDAVDDAPRVVVALEGEGVRQPRRTVDAHAAGALLARAAAVARLLGAHARLREGAPLEVEPAAVLLDELGVGDRLDELQLLGQRVAVQEAAALVRVRVAVDKDPQPTRCVQLAHLHRDEARPEARVQG